MKEILLAVALTTGLPVIDEDYGGKTYERMEAIEGMRGVEIRGVCMSSCTFYLGLPETCVHPGAKLGFHGPKMAIGFHFTKDRFEEITKDMAEYYPPAIREWFIKKARYTIDGIEIISGRKAIRMGAKPCKKD